tara:strand:- start:4011 stop:5609 length:1599 start_codon:yes stop_codon:yes gene_type:complete
MAQKLETTISAKDRSKAAFRSFGNGLKKASGAILNFKTGLVAVAGIAGIGLLVKKSLEAVDANKKLADRLGLSTQQLAGYEYAAVLAGESIDTVRSAFGKMEKNLYEAERGLGTAIYALDKLNISAKELNSLSTDERIKAVADAIAGLSTQQEKIGVAMQLFGRAGVNLVNMLDTMSEGLTEAQEKALKLGYALSSAASANIEKYNDAFARLKLSIQGLANVLTAELAIGMTQITDKLTEFLEKFVEKDGMQGLFDFFYDSIILVTKGLTNFGITILNVLKNMAEFANDSFLISGFGDVFSKETLEKLDSGVVSLKNLQGTIEANVLAYRDLAKAARNSEEIIGSTGGTGTSGQSQFADKFIKLATFGQKAGEDISTAFDTAAVTISTAFGKTFEDMIMGTKKASAAFKDLGRVIYSELVKMFVMRMIVAPFTNAFGGFLDTIIPTTGKQYGGSVSRGKPYMVGERGMEMFIPNQSGTIIPNNNLGSGTVVQNINISTGVAATVRSEIISLLPSIAEVSKGAMIDSQLRGQY